MRKILVLLLLTFVLMGCSMIGTQPIGLIYTGVTTPYLIKSEHQGAYKYKILGKTRGQASAISILGLIAVGDAGYNQAYKNALADFPQSDILIDVASDYQTTSVLGLFSIITTNISGKAVKLIPTTMGYSLKPANNTIKTKSVISQNSEPRQVIPLKESFLQKEIANGSHGMGLSYINGSGDYNESGFSLDYNFSRYLNKQFNYSAHCSFIYMSNSNGGSRNNNLYGYPVKYPAKYSSFIIPFYLNIQAKSSGFPQIQSILNKLPVKGFDPFAEAGAGWYILHRTIEPKSANYPEELKESSWHLGGIGLNFGLGSAYNLMDNLSLNAGFDYHFFLNEDNFNFWQWKIGVTLKKSKK